MSRWFAPRFIAWSLALLVFMRGLYLWRFGWDPGWMNVTYLLRAKHWVMGAPFLAEEPPLPPRRAGGVGLLGSTLTSSLAAFGRVSHVPLVLALPGLGWFLRPAAGPRRRACASPTASLVPLRACGTGRTNLALLVGAPR